MKKKTKVISSVGKRKRAVARAKMVPGTGIVKINNNDLESMENEITKLMIQEPLILSGDVFKKYDISVYVTGGGIVGQTEAVRQAIAKALIQGDKKLKEKFSDYDRSLLVADARRTEPHKPSRSKQGPRRHKQRSKR